MPESTMPAKLANLGADLHALIERHHQPNERIYGVVDAGRDQELAFEGAARWGWRLQWLFGEDAWPSLRDVAPYLVPIVYHPGYPYPQSEYLDLWADRLGGSAGILLLSEAGADEVWTHLRSIFRRTDDRGRVHYSRFYDPRVTRKLLPDLAGEQVREFFGPIGGILVEAENPDHLLICRPGQETVEIAKEPLVRVGDAASRLST